jgi:hypothetical protein
MTTPRKYIDGKEVKPVPKRRQGKGLRLARDSDRIRARGMARLFYEGKASGADLATALQLFAVRGTFDTTFPGVRTLTAEVASFDEQWKSPRDAPAESKQIKYLFVCRQYDGLRAKGIARSRAIEQIADERGISIGTVRNALKEGERNT